MTHHLKIRHIGNCLGIVLPKKVLRGLNVTVGDQLHLTATPDGFHLTAADPEFTRQMAIAEKGFQRYRTALRNLAQ